MPPIETDAPPSVNGSGTVLAPPEEVAMLPPNTETIPPGGNGAPGAKLAAFTKPPENTTGAEALLPTCPCTVTTAVASGAASMRAVTVTWAAVPTGRHVPV